MSEVSASGAPQLPPAIVLVGVTATAPVAMHMFVPSMPGLVVAFGTTPAAVQLTLTLYMFALALATLACGSISDRFGRRPVILAALALYAVAGALCAMAQSIEMLIVGRVLQALGGAAGSTWYGIIAGAPYIMVVVMNQAPSEYGTWFVLVAAGWITGNLLTSRIAPRVGIPGLVLAGALVAVAASATLVIALALESLTPPTLFVPLAIIGIGHGLSQPSAMSAAIGVRPEAAGRASGLLGFTQMACGALTAQLLGLAQTDSAWPMAIMVALMSLLSLGCYVIAAPRR